MKKLLYFIFALLTVACGSTQQKAETAQEEIMGQHVVSQAEFNKALDSLLTKSDYDYLANPYDNPSIPDSIVNLILNQCSIRERMSYSETMNLAKGFFYGGTTATNVKIINFTQRLMKYYLDQAFNETYFTEKRIENELQGYYWNDDKGKHIACGLEDELKERLENYRLFNKKLDALKRIMTEFIEVSDCTFYCSYIDAGGTWVASEHYDYYTPLIEFVERLSFNTKDKSGR